MHASECLFSIFLIIFSFRDILPEERLRIFEEEMFVDLLVFKGVAGRKHKCRLLTMDLRGLELSEFCFFF